MPLIQDNFLTGAGALGDIGARQPAGEMNLSNTPVLIGHRGGQPDLHLRWNEITDTSAAVDVVMHLHGYADGNEPMLLSQAVARSGLLFADPQNASAVRRVRQTIGIVPRGNHAGGRRQNFPALTGRDGVATLIDYALRTLAQKFGVASLRLGRLIITSHSGSGPDVEALIATSALKPLEIHLFDATYEPVPHIADWACRRIATDREMLARGVAQPGKEQLYSAGGGLRIFSGNDTAQNAGDLALKMAPELANGAYEDLLEQFYRVEKTEVGHYKIPIQFGFQLLADVSADIVGAAPLIDELPLGLGQRGERVRSWQTFLVQQTFRTRAPDANFDQGTSDETILFQRAHGLAADGKVGPNTMACARSLGFGLSGTHVQSLQNISANIQTPQGGSMPVATNGPKSTMSLTPAQRLVCERIINVYETGSITGDYANITIYNDGPNGIRQITYGRAQTTEYSNLAELVKMYVDSGGTFATQLRPYVPLVGNTALVDNEDFKNLLRRAGREDPVMARTQDAFFDKRYFQSALAWANANGFSLALSMLVIYDSFIHSGGILGFLRSRFTEKPPAYGGDEKKWISQYVDARYDWLANHENALLRQTVYRTRDFKREIGKGNWDLSQLPFSANGTPVTASGGAAPIPNIASQPGVVPYLGNAIFATSAILNPVAVAGQQPAANTGPTSEATFAVDTLEGIRAIQEVLSRCGYLDPPADGAFGPVSKWALWEFAKRAGLSSADLNGDLRSALANARELPLAPGSDLAGAIVGGMLRNNYWIARHPDCLNIVYVEGMDPDGRPNDNRNNEFNDLRVLIRVAASGQPVIAGMWDATTEPSRQWTLQPMNPGGAFHIKFGQYKAWIKGYYHNYEALIQAGEIQGYRDPHKTFKRDFNYPVSGSDFGVHHHWGYDLPHNNMGNSSAGCLVGRATQGHIEFMSLLKTDARYRANPTYRFMAAILPASDVVTDLIG